MRRWWALGGIVLATATSTGCESISDASSADDVAARDYWLEARLAKGDGGIKPLDETLEKNPAGFEDARSTCLAMVTIARVEVADAIEVARSLRDYDRMRCLESRAKTLAMLAPVIENGGNGLAETRAEEPVFAANACRMARAARADVDVCEGG
ncbi:MAG TPA: hypothetical protein VL400_19270 [Polyangiaceae bacterium]|jgi:hypothetical protein|nr:hypothetical protein [Polyangiaceae bacterium]